MKPWYLPLFRVPTRSPMRMMTSAVMPPAPTPCTILDATSIETLCDAPHRQLPAMKTEMAATNAHLRPSTSLACPNSGITTACASAYPDPTHVYPELDDAPPRLVMILGRAVDTMVWSSAGRKSVRNMLPTSTAWRALDSPWRGGSSSLGGSGAVRVPLVLSESVWYGVSTCAARAGRRGSFMFGWCVLQILGSIFSVVVPADRQS